MQNLFVFLLVLLTAANSTPEDALAQITAEPELTTSPAQSNEFMNTLPQEKGPVIVTASFELRDINDINDEAETFEFTGILKLSWHDPRQAFDPVAEGIKEKMYLGNFQFYESRFDPGEELPDNMSVPDWDVENLLQLKKSLGL